MNGKTGKKDNVPAQKEQVVGDMTEQETPTKIVPTDVGPPKMLIIQTRGS